MGLREGTEIHPSNGFGGFCRDGFDSFFTGLAIGAEGDSGLRILKEDMDHWYSPDHDLCASLEILILKGFFQRL